MSNHILYLGNQLKWIGLKLDAADSDLKARKILMFIGKFQTVHVLRIIAYFIFL